MRAGARVCVRVFHSMFAVHDLSLLCTGIHTPVHCICTCVSFAIVYDCVCVCFAVMTLTCGGVWVCVRACVHA